MNLFLENLFLEVRKKLIQNKKAYSQADILKKIAFSRRPFSRSREIVLTYWNIKLLPFSPFSPLKGRENREKARFLGLSPVGQEKGKSTRQGREYAGY